MGSPSRGGGVSRLSLPSPFSPLLSVLPPTGIFHLYFFSSINFFRHIWSFLARTVLSVYTGLSPIFLFCASLLFATSLSLCGPLETRHVDRVPLPSYRLNSPTPTADQVEEENLQLPTVVKAEEGNTLLQVIAVGQMVLASPERQTVYAMETQNTNPGRMDPPAR